MGNATQTAHALQLRLEKSEAENKDLNTALEELDEQHNLAMQNVLELKNELQEKLNVVTTNYNILKEEQADKFICSELELGKLRKEIEKLQGDNKTLTFERTDIQRKNEDLVQMLKINEEDMLDLQTLLEKKGQDNIELIEKVKIANKETEKSEDERTELLQRLEQVLKEIEELKTIKEKKTSESSSSSMGKQSEDEFILVGKSDTNSSGPTTPPTKEELKDKIVQLENRVSELTLENGSLALKLRDQEIPNNLQSLQSLEEKCEAQAENIKMLLAEQLEAQEKIDDLKERAAEAVIAQEQLKILTEEKTLLSTELKESKESISSLLELKQRLIFSEEEKEALQVELQSLRTAQKRVTELECKIQQLTLENQKFKLNAEAETETLNNSAELEDRLRCLTTENESLRTELESIAQDKFRQAIAEEKQEITDLDADEEEPFKLEKFRDVLEVYVKQETALSSEDSVDRAFKSLREKLWKIDALEKSLAQMSEDMIDLQDAKLVWDHEKKTLEADISQYILQCDELMKNNEILLNELENYKRNKLETISENNEENIVQLESQLEESIKLNTTLEKEYVDLRDKISELEHEKLEFAEQIKTMEKIEDELKLQIKDLELEVENYELEKTNLVFEMNELKAEDDKEQKSAQLLKQVEDKNESLENQLSRLSKDHADLVAAMQAQKTALVESNKLRETSENELSSLKRQALQEEQNNKLAIEEQNKLVEILTQNFAASEEEKSILKQEFSAKDIIIETLRKELSNKDQYQTQFNNAEQQNLELKQKMQEDLKKLEELRTDLHEKSNQLDVLQQKFENIKSIEENTISLFEFKLLQEAKYLIENQYEDLKKEFELQRATLEELQTSKKDLGSEAKALARIAELESQLLDTADLQKTIETLNYEKGEMIKALQQKHSENMQYYMEIQRLQPLVQQLQQQQQEMQAAIAAPKTCEKCNTLETNIVELKKQEEKLQDQINFLKEKSDILTTNLLTEQTNQKLIQQEKAEVQEQNAMIRKDLERLQKHLLEIEEMHTQETIEMERKLNETNAEMCALQDEVSKSSNAYTSASIRANQHAETLQAQYALVIQQRDELVAKLSLAEDRELKNQAALCNLQCALEQFQNDKESEIKTATLRLRKDLQREAEKKVQLEVEISNLSQNLSEANEGLLAASRLSDQLESSKENIASLREEVEIINQQKLALEQKLNQSESGQTDKIEKSLIKSLLIGYVVSANPNDKNQVLRMISSVLNFTQNESDKVGLNKQQSSWLGSILGGGSNQPGGTHSNENLVEAFVQFLEKESQPRANQNNLPNLLNITQAQHASNISGASSQEATRRTSTSSKSGTTPAPIPIQPIQLNSTILDEFQPNRNSSTILKDILSDS
ncbi:putative leucine-rich repeat-containing protein DDB_G0290503 isoform X2 [Teleopsis dalmanni]|nr:putative leucine-rich repeat-containing protein DDB_G0290503 isoform X2 [Teleopsis dalmanni]XP_037938106.1 putative leucine-rich repeat-containing protein DDB_G0290503 isoform X2 [Teleopsis dalmanni]